MMTDINQYLDFVMKMFLAWAGIRNPCGDPVNGVVRPDNSGRHGCKAARHYYWLFRARMFLTPPDVVSQLLLAIPMWLLFEVGVVLAKFVSRNEAAKDDQEAG